MPNPSDEPTVNTAQRPPAAPRSCKSHWRVLGGLAGAILLVLVGGLAPASCSVDQWVVSVSGGSAEADLVADQRGCKNLGMLKGFEGIYLFEKRVDSASLHREKRALDEHPLVNWVEPQVAQERVKRGTFHREKAARRKPPRGKAKAGALSPSASDLHVVALDTRPGPARPPAAFVPPTADNEFDDELWDHQWYLQDRSGAPAHNQVALNVEDVWRMGYTGAGVVVTILDDGLERNHTDIKPNYDALASWDMNNNRADPSPRYTAFQPNDHGTRCAGEVAMVAGNRKCGVGVAPRARIGGIKCLDGKVKGYIEALSITHNFNYIDIYCSSWGPKDTGRVLDGPDRLAKQALELGTAEGRGGKGALYVWASGNGGEVGDNGNCDGYVNSIYTIAIGAVTQQGQFPTYGERCSCTLAVACSSGSTQDKKVVTTDLHNKCTAEFDGTSAAAPLAAGIYALALEANANLTWRDVQHLTAWTSNPLPLRSNAGWRRNAAGLVFNSRFGFGLLNARALVEAALKWARVPPKASCLVRPSFREPVPLQSGSQVKALFVTDGCQRQFAGSQPPPANSSAAGQRGTGAVLHLEHVQVVLTLEYNLRGALDVFLVSPAGTVSTLLTRRPLDRSAEGFTEWPLMSVHFWGELAPGTWTLVVRDKGGRHNRGWLRDAQLLLHGTAERPWHAHQARRYEGEAEVAPFLDPVSELDEDDVYDPSRFSEERALARDDSYQLSVIKSVVAPERAWPAPNGRVRV